MINPASTIETVPFETLVDIFTARLKLPENL